MAGSRTTSLVKKESSNGNVEYCDPIVLSENTKTKVVLIPWFIRHTNHRELSLKIQSLKKVNPPHEWLEREERTLTLSGEATKKLLAELPRLQALVEEKSGEYIVIRIEDGTANVADFQPELVANALISVLNQEDVARHLEPAELSSELAKALRYSVRLSEMKSAMIELREHLDSGANEERIYQKWCEQYPWVFGHQYIVADEIRNITTQDQVDILLPRIVAGFRDIVELKRPDMDVLNYDSSHRDYYFSSEVSKAIGQCHRYLDVFSEFARNGLIGHESIVAYHPEATIVIGRSNGWGSDRVKALHGLNSRLNGIKVITYDYLLAQGECLIDYLSNASEGDAAGALEIPF